MLGPTTVLAAVSVTAYVLGGILSIDPVVSRTNPTRAMSRCKRIKWWCDIRHIYGTTEQQMTALTRERTDAALNAGLSATDYRPLLFQANAADNREPQVVFGKWITHRCLGRPKCAKRTAEKTRTSLRSGSTSRTRRWGCCSQKFRYLPSDCTQRTRTCSTTTIVRWPRRRFASASCRPSCSCCFPSPSSPQ